MAKQLTTASIATGQTINAGHVTQSSVAFTGGEAYDITISGSLEITGSTSITGTLSLPGFPDVAASLTAADDGFPFSGSALITGSLIVTGSTNLLASKASNLTFKINESASFQFLTGAPNTGSFIVQTSPDKGLGFLQSYFGQGTATAVGQPIPNQAFGITYTTGSSAANGELTMVIGKRDLSNLPGNSAVNDQNNFYVSFEPGGTFTNAQGELEFFVGEHSNVGSGVLSVFRSGPNTTSQTSSFAGYFSSSAFPNQQLHTRPFAISTILPVKNSNPAFVINKDITKLTSSSFSVDYGGNVTASSNISASGQIVGNSFKVQQAVAGPTDTSLIISGSAFDGDNRDAQIIYPTHGLHFNDNSGTNNHVLALSGNKVGVRVQPNNISGNDALTVSGSIKVIDGDISASGDFHARQITGSKLAIGNPIPTAVGYTGITSKFNGGAFFNITSETTKVFGIHDSPDGADILQIDTDPDQFLIDPINNGYKVGIGTAAPPEKLTVQGNISASGNGIFKAGKPIITHTANLTASLANAGLYHIVGGTLTCSVSISSAPIGAEYEFFQTQSGNFLFETGSGITLISKNDSLRLAQLGSSAVLKKVGTSTFHLMGDLT